MFISITFDWLRNAFSNHLKHKIRGEIWWTVVEDEDYLNLKCLSTQTETVGHTR